MHVEKWFVLILLLTVTASTSADTGSIQGNVVSKKTKQPLVGANVVIDGSDKGAASNIDGRFVISNIEPGSYNITIYYLGYRTVRKSNIIVNPKRTAQLLIEMDEDILQSETVEITASYFEKPKEAVVSTRSMDFEEIRRTPGAAVDIQRVMQALPAVVSGTDQNNEIIVRGGMPGENLFLMDDLEIPNPNHFGEQGAGGGPINLINSFMVRNVDFYAGAFSAKYGDKASSVMDIRLREGTQERHRGELYVGMGGAGALVEGPVPERTGSYIFSARKSFLDLIISSTGLTAVPKFYNLQGKIRLDLGLRNTLFINGIYGADRINIEDEGTGGYSRGAENVDYVGDQLTFGATLRTFWSNDTFSRTTVSSAKNAWEIDVYGTDDGETYFLNESRESEYTIKTDFVSQMSDDIELNWGGSLKSVDLDHDIWAEQDTIFWYSGVNDIDPDSVFQTYPAYTVKNSEKSYKTALYTQVSVDLFRRTRLTAGLRYDYFDYNRFQSISPRLGASYFVNPRMTLNIAYGRHYQSPSYLELTANPVNKKLKSKYTRQYVGGLEYLLRDDVKLTLEAYYKEYDDVPVWRSSTTPDPFDSYSGELVNSGTGYARGLEFFLQKKLTDNVSAIVSYSYSVSRAKDLRNDTDYDWDYDYRNVFTVIGGYKVRPYRHDWFREMKKKWWYKATAWLPFLPSDEVEASLKWRYLGGRPYTPPIYHPEWHTWVVEEQQHINASRYPEYHRFDLRIDRRFIFGSWSMVVFFDMMNVYNRHNIWEHQYNDDGTTEDILQFEVFPIGGVSVEF